MWGGFYLFIYMHVDQSAMVLYIEWIFYVLSKREIKYIFLKEKLSVFNNIFHTMSKTVSNNYVQIT